MKKSLQTVFGRLLYTAVFVTLQVAVVVVMFLFFQDKFAYFYAVCILVSLVATVEIVNNNSNPAYKIAWVIPILLFPIFGGLAYLMFGKYPMTKKQKDAGAVMQQRCREGIACRPGCLAELAQQSPEAALHARYIDRAAGVPPYTHTETDYFPIGEEMFAAMLRELESAKSFIFMEYFIVERGEMWDSILEILERKAKAGVEVRVMYDDLGCLFTLPRKYYKTLRQKGIQACVFNPFNTILSPRFNNRDHRKICVIDGNVGFTGGINLADEYINRFEKHGHWKDGGILLRGQAVWALTVFFLSLWDFSNRLDEDYSPFAPDPAVVDKLPENGFVQPYTDIPLDDEQVGENVYLNLIGRAQRYLYITTPYLIVDNETVTALCNAAKSGVDIRIITPHIPDKKMVFYLTRSYYRVLLQAGVRIYEYTPGFIHSKTFVSDDQYGVVGTINLDYRSLYLHCECAAWLYNCSAVGQVRDDFLSTLEQSEEITLEHLPKLPWYRRWTLGILKAFAPLA
ncbi:MAG: cardiolipin synthase [Oscillospiraceae bacterium]